jgi:hypothetical protein
MNVNLGKRGLASGNYRKAAKRRPQWKWQLFTKRLNALDVNGRTILTNAKVNNQRRDDGTADLHAQCGQAISWFAKASRVSFEARQNYAKRLNHLVTTTG